MPDQSAKDSVCNALCRNNWSGYGTACASGCTAAYADENSPCERATAVWDSDAQHILDALPQSAKDKAVREMPIPSPTGTELALIEAKRYIDLLTRFSMNNPGWYETAEAARAFIGNIPVDNDVLGDLLIHITDSRNTTAKAASEMLAALEAIKQFGELNCEPVRGYWGNSGKKPPTKDVWQFPRFMLPDIEAAIAAAHAAGIKPEG